MKNNETQSLDTRAKAQSQERKKENPSTKLSHPYYTQLWSSRNPRLIVFLLDQSASMVEIYGDTGKTKADYAADIVSFQINEFILRNKYRGTFSNRVYVVVIGYGGDDPKKGVEALLAGKVEDLALDDKYPFIEDSRSSRPIKEVDDKWYYDHVLEVNVVDRSTGHTVFAIEFTVLGGYILKKDCTIHLFTKHLEEQVAFIMPYLEKGIKDYLKTKRDSI